MKARIAALSFAFLCFTLWSSSQAFAGGKGGASPPAIADPKFSVLSPLGTPPPIKQLGMAPRPSSLDGRTIYIVDDGFPGGDVLLNEMAEWFRRNIPGVTVNFRRKAGPFEAEDPALFAEIRAKGDAVIMGMGH